MALISYAQHCEDVVLHRALGHIERGFYVDVGAYRPVDHSATKLFYDAGWSGINLEPCQRWVDELMVHRPRDRNLRVAVSDRQGEIEFHEVGGSELLSTTRGETAQELRRRGINVMSYKVPTRTLADILDEHAPSDVHFLKVDVEGAETLVLRGADFSRHRPWVLVIEDFDAISGERTHDWEPIVFAAGYRFGMTHDLNRFYWASERPELEAALSVPFEEYTAHMALPREVREEYRACMALPHEVRRLTAELHGIKSSRSWRATAPLRAIAAHVRHLCGVGSAQGRRPESIQVAEDILL
jgi:FkbM family methyltransferase